MDLGLAPQQQQKKQESRLEVSSDNNSIANRFGADDSFSFLAEASKGVQSLIMHCLFVCICK